MGPWYIPQVSFGEQPGQTFVLLPAVGAGQDELSPLVLEVSCVALFPQGWLSSARCNA